MKMTQRTEVLKYVNPIGVILDFPDLLYDEGADWDGAIISEVGKSRTISLKGVKIPTYFLREKSKKPIPSHVFGKAILGDFGSVWHFQSVAVPAVGAVDLILPQLSEFQTQWLNPASRMRAYRYSVTYIIRIDEPLGASHLMELTPLTLNHSNKVKGIKWKPAAQPCIAVTIPWRFEFTMKSSGIQAQMRRGYDANVLLVETLEDNSVETISSPVRMCIYTLVHDVECSAVTPYVTTRAAASTEVLDPLESQIVINEKPEYFYTQADEDPQASADKPSPGDVNVEAGGIDVVTPQAPEDKGPEKAKNSKRYPGTSKNQQGPLNTKWTYWRTITISQNLVGRDAVFTFDPFLLDKKGDSIARPFRRNVWFKGSYKHGFVTIWDFKLVSNRVPQIAGMMEASMGPNTGRELYPRVLHKFGGAPTEFSVVPSAFVITSSASQVRADAIQRVNRNWLKCTTDAACTFTLRPVSYNVSDEVADMKVKIFVKPGDLQFQVPLRPKAVPVRTQAELEYVEGQQITASLVAKIAESLRNQNLNLEEFQTQATWAYDYAKNKGLEGDDLRRFVERAEGHWVNGSIDDGDIGDNLEQVNEYLLSLGVSIDDECYVFLGGDDAPIIAPGGNLLGDSGESCAATFLPDKIDQDDFWVNVGTIQAVPGQTMRVPLNLMVVNDEMGHEGNNPIAEKFRRFAHVAPTGRGDYGPVIGEYRLVCHLPTGVAANIAHVCIPPDMNEFTALGLFGLENILGIAGSVLSSIGGPILSGAISTIGGLFNNAGGFAGPSGAANESENPSQAPPAISGQLPIAKVFEFIKSLINQTTTPDSAIPVFGNLLFSLIDVISNTGLLGLNEIETIPVRVFVKMQHAGFERSVFDRVDIDDSTPGNNSLYLDRAQMSCVLDAMNSHPSERSKVLAKKLLGKMYRVYKTPSDLEKFVDISDLENEEEIKSSEMATLVSLLAHVSIQNSE